MTTREFYSAVVSADFSAELTEKANELLSAMDARNEKRKSTESKEKKETAARKSAVLDFLTENSGKPFTRDEIAEALDITPGQVTAACKSLVADEAIVKAETKVGKARKVIYSKE